MIKPFDYEGPIPIHNIQPWHWVAARANIQIGVGVGHHGTKVIDEYLPVAQVTNKLWPGDNKGLVRSKPAVEALLDVREDLIAEDDPRHNRSLLLYDYGADEAQAVRNVE